MKNGRMVALVGGIVALVIIVISVVFIIRNNYLYQFEVVGVENYSDKLPGEMKENLEKQLRGLLRAKFDVGEDEIITAQMRGETYKQDSSNDVTTASFLLDIDDYQQTYNVVMSWSDKVVISDAILISCPEERLMKYPDAKCLSMYDTSQDLKNISDNPIYKELPVVVNEFDFGERKSIHYELRGYFNADNELVLMIVDYSGGNYENGLEIVRKLGYNPKDYSIQYYNQAGDI